ncbi:MAG TPA: hypothetical protein VN577_19950 [Terriglobales bacterium]|nr:hypothetical protein [Terriglobales bacterium]
MAVPKYEDGVGPTWSGPWEHPEPNFAGKATMQTLQTGFSIPYPIAYGYVRAVGNVRLLAELPDKSKVAIIILGGGEWDGIERFWLYRRILQSLTNIVHFHPGVLPALGTGLGEISTGGDNNVDTFFSYLPANVQRVTFPRVAYIGLHAAPDPRAAYPDLEWLGDYRALKIRKFDAGGAQTAYAWSLNPIEQAADLRFRLQLMREGLPGEEPTAAVKSRIDWPAFADSVAYCNEVLANGKPRFICSKAWTETKSLKEMEDEILMTCRGYKVEANGKVQYRIDKPRATTFALTGAHIRAVSTQFHEKNIEGAKNRYIGKFRDLNPMAVANITSISRTSYTITVATSTPHGFVEESAVEVVGVAPASFNGQFRVVTVPDSTHLTYAQVGLANEVGAGGALSTPESRFSERSVILDHKAHQLHIGVRGVGIPLQARQEDAVYDFGVSTRDQVHRVLKYMMTKNLGLDQTPYKAPVEGRLVCDLYGIDSADRALAAQLPGDTVALETTASYECADDYEIMKETLKVTKASEESNDSSTVELELHEYLPDAFPDTSDEEQVMTPAAQGTGLPGVSTFDNDGTEFKAMTAVHTNSGPTTNPLSGVALSGTAGKVIVNPFTNRVGGSDIPCLSAPYEITGGGITQGQKYTAYFDDPFWLGGDITPQLTQDESILRNAKGRFVIGEVKIPFASPTGQTLRPSTYSDSGDVSAVDPTKAFDENNESYAIVASEFSSPDGFDCNCVWSGVPAHAVVSPSAIHLKIKYVAVGKTSCFVAIRYSVNGGSSWSYVPGFPTNGSLSGIADIPLLTSQLTQNIRVQVYTDVPPNLFNRGYVYIHEIWIEVS